MSEELINEILTDLVGNWSRASDIQDKFDAINQAKSALANGQQELAQKVLEMIGRTEDATQSTHEFIKIAAQESLLDEIKQLCQEEVKKQ